MKTVLAAALASQAATAAPIVLQHHNFVDLVVPSSTVILNVGYPGMQNRSCGIELRSSNQFGSQDGLTKLARAIQVANGFRTYQELPGQGGTVLRYLFSAAELGKYMTLVKIRARAGTLAETIENTVKPGAQDDPKPRVIATLVDCEN